MKKIIFKVFLFFSFIFFSGASFTSRVLAAEYPISSSDGKVKVVLDGKFGGAITQLYDYANMGIFNLIDGYQAGAMFQTAFWILPYHNYQPPYVNNDSRIPPGCAGSGDQFLDNPTQAGYVADGRAGNPIGIMGTDTNTPDPNEFINYEDGNKTIHLKTRFIRYDYCKNGSAPMSERQWWDTDFYLEQWASFHPSLPDTLVLRNKITYTGTGQKSTTTRQLPVIFACNLPRVAYWQGGQKVINLTTEGNINPDINWTALIASNKEAGIGMVTSGTMSPMLGRGKFGYGQILGSTSQCVNNGPLSVLYPGAGVPDLRNFGTLSNVDGPTSDHIFTFNPGGSFEWTTYYPVGTLDMIKQNSEAILDPLPLGWYDADHWTAGCTVSGWTCDPSNYGASVPVNVYVDGTTPADLVVISATASTVHSPSDPGPNNHCNGTAHDFFISNSDVRQALINAGLDPNVQHRYRPLAINIDSSGNTRVQDAQGNWLTTWLNKYISDTATCAAPPTPTSTPTPLPVPGDLNHDSKVNISDYNILLQNFGNSTCGNVADIDDNCKVDILDYNILVGNFGRL